MPRGGKRSGAPGKSYAHRTDMNAAPRHLPAVAIPGQEYGAQAAQLRAQAAVPTASGPLPPAAPSGPPAPPGNLFGAMAGGGNWSSIVDAPTARPDEHPMAGNPMGPGPGPEALNNPLPAPPAQLKAVAALNSIAGALPPAARALHRALSVTQANEMAP